MKNSYQKLRSGFTLLELLVVVAIISILSAIASPAFISVIAKFRVTSEITDLVGDLQYARSEATKEGVSVLVCPSTDYLTCATTSTWNSGKAGSTGWIIARMKPDGVTIATVLRARKAFESVDTLVSDNPTPYSVAFTRDGFATGLPTTGTMMFTLSPTGTASSATKCVTLNKAGRLATLSKGTSLCGT